MTNVSPGTGGRQGQLLRTALVGCGKIAETHLSGLDALDDVEVVALVDRDPSRLRGLAGAVPDAALYSDLGSMLTRERPDVVHVLTPPETHASLALEAIESECHVLIEKPIALSSNEVDEVFTAAQRRGVIVSTCHNLLFTPAVRAARELVGRGEIGAVTHVVSFYGISEEGGIYTAERAGGHWAWRLRGGVFTNFLPHIISLHQAFSGGIEEVVGVALSQEGSRASTELVALTRGRDAPGTITLSMRSRPDMTFVEVFGTRGVIRADLVREVCTVQRHRRVPRSVGKVLYAVDFAAQLLTGTMSSALRVLTGRLRSNPGLPVLIRQFYDSVRSHTSPPVSAEEACGMVATMEAIWAKTPALASDSTRMTVGGPQTAVERDVASRADRPSTVLVTGANGFLGSRVVTALARCGIDVRALVRDTNRVPFQVEAHARVVQGALEEGARLRSALEGVDVVINCAAVTDSRATWDVHEQGNVVGMRTLLAAATDADVRRVVHVSSVAVYGLKDGVFDEHASLDDGNRWAHYQRSKVESERILRVEGKGLEVTVLRLGLLHGPGKAPKTALMRLGRVHLVAGTGRNHLPYTSVDSAVDCILLAAASPSAVGETYNVVDEPQGSVRDAIARYAEGPPPIVVPIPRTVLLAAAAALERRSARRAESRPPKLSRYVVRSATRDALYATDKIRSQLGWAPQAPTPHT